MSTTTESEQTWTFASIGLALVHIETAFNWLQLNPDGQVNNQTRMAIEEARRLKHYLEIHQSVCPAAALACCNRLLEAQGT